MPRRVECTPSTERDLRLLSHQVRARIREAVERFGVTDRGDVKRLQGRDRQWRLRVADWRVIFTLADDHLEGGTIAVVRVLPRERACRD